MTVKKNLTIPDELDIMIKEYDAANPETPLNLSVIFQNALKRKLNQE